MKPIDLSPAIDAITAKYPDAYRSPEALAELIALWGGAGCNDAGVMQSRDRVRIELHGNPRWRAEIRLAQAPNGYWAMATSYDTPTSGGGSAPSVWNRTAYHNRDTALDAGIAALVQRFEQMRDASGVSETNSRYAACMAEQLRQFRRQATQLTLF